MVLIINLLKCLQTPYTIIFCKCHVMSSLSGKKKKKQWKPYLVSANKPDNAIQVHNFRLFL